MKKIVRFAVVPIILFVAFSCASTPKTTVSPIPEKRPALFSFLPIDTKTIVVPTKEKLTAMAPQGNPFADIKKIPQDKIEKLITANGIDPKKTFKQGESLSSFVNGKVIDVDPTGSSGWGKYILIEGSYTYFLSNGKKEVVYRVLICYLAAVAPDIQPMATVKTNMALGTVQVDTPLKSTNILVFTPDVNDIFLNFSTPSYPVDYMNNRWFHVYTILNENTQRIFWYPEWSPHEAAYTFCHWHDPETGEERRDPPPQNYNLGGTIIQSGCRFSLLLEKKPHLLTPEEKGKIESTIGAFRNILGFGDFVSVTSWQDTDYTYYLFWGPSMNKYIQEEWDPKNPVLISAMIITADVATNSIVFYVGDFSYKGISPKLEQVKSTVIKLED
ncbi:hypothetical protein [Treponema sp. J25]|uniref:hypothetical protein n=1 Tax=Treponema sp. J25 TaxID=2094121 RepID=UPI001047F1FC|nr:hypothetical protein [Treponema sp. J25]